MLTAELHTPATLGMDCLAHLLVLALPVAAGLDQSLRAKVLCMHASACFSCIITDL